ncbi:hypothetical protein UFOVP190_240 [uncultured Caudovirales phage]|uniref:Uncharacterized protein n=1 Tax=uncultured Caudovirales phage TaxID=2100421 RepID=A0A6J7WH97_9CAUD|nr:hypothetical protein UFOVP190_240 [uncultured Caudovirales phage]
MPAKGIAPVAHQACVGDVEGGWPKSLAPGPRGDWDCWAAQIQPGFKNNETVRTKLGPVVTSFTPVKPHGNSASGQPGLPRRTVTLNTTSWGQPGGVRNGLGSTGCDTGVTVTMNGPGCLTVLVGPLRLPLAVAGEVGARSFLSCGHTLIAGDPTVLVGLS